MPGTNFTDPAHLYELADGDPELALWLALEVRELNRFIGTVSEALEEWEPMSPVESVS
jgi:hypothetical protein